MKTILALLFAALVVNAAVRMGDSVWRNYQIEDAVNQETRYGNSKTASMLRKKIVELAAEQQVALREDEVVVERRGTETYVSLAYAEELELIPATYRRLQEYEITMSVQPVRPLQDEK
jgi:hypothetical protein